jgi:ABC-type amino acid transport substrate-binding protein
MKRKWGLVGILIVVIAVLFIGCSGKNGKIEKLADLQGKLIGVINLGLPASSQWFDRLIVASMEVKPKEIVTFNRLQDAVAGVTAGKIDAAYTASVVADYYTKRNDSIKAIPGKQNHQVNAVMILRSEDVKLRDEINNALVMLAEKGTLKKLQDEWIINLPSNNEPKAAEIPKIAGAKTVRIGVCGDVVPMDYVAADGRPAGYNVALVTEIGKASNINFEFVAMETPAKFAALQSKKIDVIFIHLDVQSNNLAAITLFDNNQILTRPYFTFMGTSFVVKK